MVVEVDVVLVMVLLVAWCWYWWWVAEVVVAEVTVSGGAVLATAACG